MMHDREKYIEILSKAAKTVKEFNEDTPIKISLECVEDILELLKEQEAVEPKTGHWIYKNDDELFKCSCCEKYSTSNNYPYCHWCGAKMDMDDEVELG